MKTGELVQYFFDSPLVLLITAYPEGGLFSATVVAADKTYSLGHHSTKWIKSSFIPSKKEMVIQ